MKYCPNCGAEVKDGAQFCSSCGEKTDGKNIKKEKANRPKVEEKDLITMLILSIVTCGIYAIIWFINIVDDVNKVCADENSNRSGGSVFILTLITCGIYGIIWFYQAGKRLNVAGSKYDISIPDNSTLYLVLELLGLGVVNYYLIQRDLNAYFSK